MIKAASFIEYPLPFWIFLLDVTFIFLLFITGPEADLGIL
jgi:hypothetical protein